ncbi:protein of unknown function [Xenorhabdus bovienii]|uniref:Uncharacterized protein n=1 Tax=Xenorhabdus bovienii TaxID=40576 RepID=A0A0B6XDK9_XENBV|nr:protein of unknown function [Xenorhabdus bovienii]
MRDNSKNSKKKAYHGLTGKDYTQQYLLRHSLQLLACIGWSSNS